MKTTLIVLALSLLCAACGPPMTPAERNANTMALLGILAASQPAQSHGQRCSPDVLGGFTCRDF